jgi:hypothetical protein
MDHVGTLARISEFLGISSFPNTGPKREFPQVKGPFPSRPSEVDRAFIADLVREEIQEFAALTGLDVADWPVMKYAPIVRAAPIRREAQRVRRPNVLFIVADDLNGWIGAMGRQPDVKTPAIDALARRGTLFTRAYCAAPYCNASRMAVFTACLPTTTGVYNNEPFWDAPFRRRTYVETLKEAGYYTFGTGKVFHGVYDYARAGRDRSVAAEWITVENRAQLWDRFDTSEPEPLPSDRPLNRLFDLSDFPRCPLCIITSIGDRSRIRPKH